MSKKNFRPGGKRLDPPGHRKQTSFFCLMSEVKVHSCDIQTVPKLKIQGQYRGIYGSCDQ